MAINEIIRKSLSGEVLAKEECIELLKTDDASQEAFEIRSAAASIVRKRNGNTGYIFGQIGLACSPCEGNCSFCSFAKDNTKLPIINLDDATIAEKTKAFTKNGDLHVLYIMMMHTYNLDRFIECIKIVKKNITGSTMIVSNVGDTSYEDFVKMKKAGLDGVYHCWRLGEGRDTTFDPEQRKQTMRNAKKAGLEILDALEPIGPEHTAEEMAEHIIFSRKMNVYQSGAMKRISVPGTPFENSEEITAFKLSKIVAVMVLAFNCMERMPIMGVHEPNPLCYISGANMISAETGVNPRDTAVDTSQSRGWDVARCKTLLKETGFDRVAMPDGSFVKL